MSMSVRKALGDAKVSGVHARARIELAGTATVGCPSPLRRRADR
jgi:hypothetical protein